MPDFHGRPNVVPSNHDITQLITRVARLPTGQGDHVLLHLLVDLQTELRPGSGIRSSDLIDQIDRSITFIEGKQR